MRPEGTGRGLVEVDGAFPSIPATRPDACAGRSGSHMGGNPLGEPDVMRVGYVPARGRMGSCWTCGCVRGFRRWVVDDRNRVVAVISATTDKNCNLGIAR